MLIESQRRIIHACIYLRDLVLASSGRINTAQLQHIQVREQFSKNPITGHLRSLIGRASPSSSIFDMSTLSPLMLMKKKHADLLGAGGIASILLSAGKRSIASRKATTRDLATGSWGTASSLAAAGAPSDPTPPSGGGPQHN
jgi:hypothetical protein